MDRTSLTKITLELLQSIQPNFRKIQESDIDGLGWQVTALDNKDKPISSGTHESKETARRIAIAEMVERAIYTKLKNDQSGNSFLLGTFPTSCGFAAGFEEETSRLRSICEAVERWSWSKWIDSNFVIDEYTLELRSLSDFTKRFLKPFSSMRCFKRRFSIFTPSHANLELQFSVFLGFFENGVMPGSRVCSLHEDPWPHAIIEAWRHWNIYRNSRNHTFPLDDLVNGRIQYFGSNANHASQQISRARLLEWPTPKIILHKKFELTPKPFVLWRTLCDDYVGWHMGGKNRFVY